MKDTIYLIFTKTGIKRTTKTPPNLGAGEHATCLEMKVPDRFFTNPIPTATMEIPESAVGGPAPTIDLQSMEEICLVQEGVADRNEEGKSCYRCPACGFEHWRRDMGSHYRPKEPPT